MVSDLTYPSLDDVTEAALSAGRTVREFFLRPPALAALKKTDGSLLTEADLASNKILQDTLMRIRPTATWFSEEGRHNATGDWQEAWIVDPLDGTREFVDRRPEFSISVAWYAGGDLRLAVVVNPATGEGGAWSEREGLRFWDREGGAIRTGNAPEPRYAVVVSRGEHSRGHVAAFGSRLPPMIPLGSVAYKLLLVASGASDLFFTVEPKSEWDIAGGIALVQAAGKTAVRFDRKPLLFNQPGARIKTGIAIGSIEMVARFLDDCATEIESTERLIAEGTVR